MVEAAVPLNVRPLLVRMVPMSWSLQGVQDLPDGPEPDGHGDALVPVAHGAVQLAEVVLLAFHVRRHLLQDGEDVRAA